MFVLDTNVISELMSDNPWPAVLAWVDEQRASDLFVTAITEAEVRTGVAARSYGAAVVTRNVPDFAGTGVAVINPWIGA